MRNTRTRRPSGKQTARAEILGVLERLGLEAGDPVRDSYLELLHAD